MSDEEINSIKTSDYGLTPYWDYYETNKIRVKLNGDCLKQDRPTLFCGGIINVYIVYEITDTFNPSSYPTLENCLFGVAKLTKNADIDKYRCYSYGSGFDRHGFLSHLSGGTSRNVIIFGVDMSFSTKIEWVYRQRLITEKKIF